MVSQIACNSNCFSTSLFRITANIISKHHIIYILGWEHISEFPWWRVHKPENVSTVMSSIQWVVNECFCDRSSMIMDDSFRHISDYMVTFKSNIARCLSISSFLNAYIVHGAMIDGFSKRIETQSLTINECYLRCIPYRQTCGSIIQI